MIGRRLTYTMLLLVMLCLSLGPSGRLPAASEAVGVMQRGMIDGGVAAPAIRPPDLAPPAAVSLAARSGSVTFMSAAMQRPLPYLAFLPPGHDAEPDRRYPVLYMLHGMGGTYTEWYGYGIFSVAEDLMTSGDIPPFIIVLPQGDYDYWVDHADGGPAWGTYVARDLVDEIDGRYRTVADGAHRAIGGLSMGAHGALQLALTHPGTFSIVGAHSPTLRGHDEAPPYFGDAAYFAAHDPVTLVQQHPDAARALTIFLDDGADDVWLAVDTDFHHLLTSLGVAHEWHVYPGGHEGSYWTANLESYLRFYGAAFARQMPERSSATALPYEDERWTSDDP